MQAAKNSSRDHSITRKAFTNKPATRFTVSHTKRNEADTDPCLHFITFGYLNGPTQVEPPAILSLDLSSHEPPPEHLCDRFTGLDKEIAGSFFSIRANEDKYQKTLTEIEQKMRRRPPGGCATILINCMSGWHRSVAMAERLAEAMRQRNGFRAICIHLDLSKNDRIRAKVATTTDATKMSEDVPKRGGRRLRHQTRATSEAQLSEKKTRGAAATADAMSPPINGPLRRKTVLHVAKVPVPEPQPLRREAARRSADPWSKDEHWSRRFSW